MKTKSLHNQLVEWRQDLHMNPQIGFEEEFASNKVASLLKDFGLKRTFLEMGAVFLFTINKEKYSNRSVRIPTDGSLRKTLEEKLDWMHGLYEGSSAMISLRRGTRKDTRHRLKYFQQKMATVDTISPE